VRGARDARRCVGMLLLLLPPARCFPRPMRRTARHRRRVAGGSCCRLLSSEVHGCPHLALAFELLYVLRGQPLVGLVPGGPRAKGRPCQARSQRGARSLAKIACSAQRPRPFCPTEGEPQPQQGWAAGRARCRHARGPGRQVGGAGSGRHAHLSTSWLLSLSTSSTLGPSWLGILGGGHGAWRRPWAATRRKQCALGRDGHAPRATRHAPVCCSHGGRDSRGRLPGGPGTGMCAGLRYPPLTR
jgi:hypothetical protein